MAPDNSPPSTRPRAQRAGLRLPRRLAPLGVIAAALLAGGGSLAVAAACPPGSGPPGQPTLPTLPPPQSGPLSWPQSPPKGGPPFDLPPAGGPSPLPGSGGSAAATEYPAPGDWSWP